VRKERGRDSHRKKTVGAFCHPPLLLCFGCTHGFRGIPPNTTVVVSARERSKLFALHSVCPFFPSPSLSSVSYGMPKKKNQKEKRAAQNRPELTEMRKTCSSTQSVQQSNRVLQESRGDARKKSNEKKED